MTPLENAYRLLTEPNGEEAAFGPVPPSDMEQIRGLFKKAFRRVSREDVAAEIGCSVRTLGRRYLADGAARDDVLEVVAALFKVAYERTDEPDEKRTADEKRRADVCRAVPEIMALHRHPRLSAASELMRRVLNQPERRRQALAILIANGLDEVPPPPASWVYAALK